MQSWRKKQDFIMKNINEKELQFVAKHYKQNSLDADSAWKRFVKRTGYKSTDKYRRIAVAASVCVVFGIAIAGGIWYANTIETTPSVTVPVSPEYRFIKKHGKTVILKYDNEPIGNVLKELSAYYGKQISISDSTRRISGEIEAASMEEIVEILEVTLNISIEVR